MSGKTTYLYFLNQLLIVEEHDLAEIALRLLPETPHRGRQLGLRTDFRLNRTHGPISAKRRKKTPGQQNIAKSELIRWVCWLVSCVCEERVRECVSGEDKSHYFLYFVAARCPSQKQLLSIKQRLTMAFTRDLFGKSARARCWVYRKACKGARGAGIFSIVYYKV